MIFSEILNSPLERESKTRARARARALDNITWLMEMHKYKWINRLQKLIPNGLSIQLNSPWNTALE